MSSKRGRLLSMSAGAIVSAAAMQCGGLSSLSVGFVNTDGGVSAGAYSGTSGIIPDSSIGIPQMFPDSSVTSGTTGASGTYGGTGSFTGVTGTVAGSTGSVTGSAETGTTGAAGSFTGASVSGTDSISDGGSDFDEAACVFFNSKYPVGAQYPYFCNECTCTANVGTVCSSRNCPEWGNGCAVDDFVFVTPVPPDGDAGAFGEDYSSGAGFVAPGSVVLDPCDDCTCLLDGGLDCQPRLNPVPDCESVDAGTCFYDAGYVSVGFSYHFSCIDCTCAPGGFVCTYQGSLPDGQPSTWQDPDDSCLTCQCSGTRNALSTTCTHSCGDP